MKKNPTHVGAYRVRFGCGGALSWASAVTGATTAATTQAADNAFEST